MPRNIIEKHLEEIFKHVGVSPDFTIEKDGEAFRIDIEGDDLSFLIGYRGESLNALQHVLGHAILKEHKEWVPITVDINGYRHSKLEKLEEMVKGYIDRARFHQKEIRLPPLTPFERRHVHTLVSDYIDIESESRGEGSERRLFLIPIN